VTQAPDNQKFARLKVVITPQALHSFIILPSSMSGLPEMEDRFSCFETTFSQVVGLHFSRNIELVHISNRLNENPNGPAPHGKMPTAGVWNKNNRYP
jgi:hypothetical protein